MNKDRFKNSKGLTKYSLICGYIEKKQVLDSTTITRIIDGQTVLEPVEVTLYHEGCFHAQRSDWVRIRDGSGGDGEPAWYSSDSLTATRQAAKILRRRLLTDEDIQKLNQISGR